MSRTAQEKRFVQSMDILMKLLLRYKRVQLHHVQSMISLTDAIADLISKSDAMKNLLTR